MLRFFINVAIRFNPVFKLSESICFIFKSVFCFETFPRPFYTYG